MNMERIIYTLTILALYIVIALNSAWYTNFICIGLVIASIMFGIQAQKEGWVK